MFVSKCHFLISLIFFGCQTAENHFELSHTLGLRDEGSTGEAQVVAQCVFFGGATAYMDCLMVMPNDERYISVSEISILTEGSDATASLSTDRRLSGESLYSARFHYQTASQSRADLAARGLPRILSGDIFRGVPGKGGTALMKSIVCRIDRELYWGKPVQDPGSALYFAFRDASTIWAVPLTKHLDLGKAIVSMRVLDRVNQEDLDRLERGTLIAIEHTGTKGKTMFRFLQGSSAYKGSHLRRQSYNFEIIEE
jgi:hypothetical protein